jgi:hypothetical protein
MIALLKCEYLKSRRKYIFLTALMLVAFQMAFTLRVKYTEPFVLQNGYMLLLYQLPVTNCIFLPVISTVAASRLCDLEHRGDNFKQLCTVADKGKIFDAKLLYGLVMVCVCVVLGWIVPIMAGKLNGFAGEIPWHYEGMFLLFTLITTAAIYIFQLGLSLLVKNQAAALSVGALGEFIGVFALFLPQLPWLRKSVLWGYYGVLDFVGLYGYTKESRWDKAYLQFEGYDWAGFVTIGIAAVLLYVLFRELFIRKEI